MANLSNPSNQSIHIRDPHSHPRPHHLSIPSLPVVGGSADQPLVIGDENDDAMSSTTEDGEEVISITSDDEFIDAIDLENDIPELEHRALTSLQELNAEARAWDRRRTARSRQLHLLPDRLPSVTYRGININVNADLELSGQRFLRLLEIRQDGNRVLLLGYKYMPLAKLNCFSWQINEVCKCLDIEQDSDGRLRFQDIFAVNLEEFRRLCRIAITNHAYPHGSIYADRHTASRDHAIRSGPIFCRWSCGIIMDRTGPRRAVKLGDYVERMRPKDCDPEYIISEDLLRREWRRLPVPDLVESQSPLADEQCHYDMELALRLASQQDGLGIDPATHLSTLARRYTFIDLFSGCGGTTRGAVLTGLRPIYACDKDADAIASYRTSFPYVRAFVCDIQQYLSHDLNSIATDVLHLSPPCQTFSPAHTIASDRDDANEASSWCIGEALRKHRPRVATLENTFGLMNRHADKMFSILSQFTSCGYSFSTRVRSLDQHGIAQSRRRLIVIAAGPGEKLPPMPLPTHGGAHQKPPVSMREAIGHIPLRWANHNPESMPRLSRIRLASQAPAGTVTTNGGNLYHPDGTRALTIREFACLQGFPLWHMFADVCATTLKRQIGNAFPPLFVKQLYDEVIKSLLNTDGLLPNQLRPQTGDSSEVAIVIA